MTLVPFGFGLGMYSVTSTASTSNQIISTTAQTTNDIFTIWTNQITDSARLNVWSHWVGGTTTSRQYNPIPTRELTEPEIAEARAAKVRRDAHYAKIEEAKKRAEELLLSHLTPAQRADYLRAKWFIVEGRSGERFRVHADRGVHGNIIRLEGEREIERLCFRAEDRAEVPHCDHLLTQKLMLQNHIDEVLRTAGRTRLAA